MIEQFILNLITNGLFPIAAFLLIFRLHERSLRDFTKSLQKISETMTKMAESLKHLEQTSLKK